MHFCVLENCISCAASPQTTLRELSLRRSPRLPIVGCTQKLTVIRTNPEGVGLKTSAQFQAATNHHATSSARSAPVTAVHHDR